MMRIRGLCCLLILVLGFSFQSYAEPDMRIGVSAPLTGPAAAWGNDVKNVLIFANEELTGGKYKLIFQDDKCDPKEAVTIAHKFSDIDKLRYVFLVAGSITLASAPVYQRAGILVMAPIVTPRAFSKLGDYIFRTTPSDSIAAALLADYVAKKHKTVAVLSEEAEYSAGFLDDFSHNAHRLGLLVSNEDFAPADTNFKSSLLRIKSRVPDALFVNANTERAFALILKQLRELKIELPIFGAYIPGSAAFIALAGKDAEGIVFPDYPSALSVLNPQGKKLYDEFTSRFGALQSFDYAFPAVFEAFRAFHAAVSSGASPREYLHRTSFEGIFGPFSFDKNGDVIGVSPALKSIKDGRAIVIQP